MKTKRFPIILAICLGLIAVVITIKIWLHTMRIEHSAVSTSGTNDSNIGNNSGSADGGFFKTITDLQAGQYAVVNSDKTKVILKDKNGKMIWTTDVMAKMPPQMRPGWGNEISHLQLFSNKLVVSVGRATAVIDKETGKVGGWSSD